MGLIEKVTIPEGRRGPWSVERFTIDKHGAMMERIHALSSGRGATREGTYTRLVHAQRGVVMSDTHDEMRDHYGAVLNATGHVLLNGLGIGMVLGAILKKPEVKNVTVVEIDADVIALVGPHYDDPRVTIVNASAFDYQPPKNIRYGAVWHDIWDNICADNLPEMTRLKRKYGRRADWQGCWAEWQCRRGL